MTTTGNSVENLNQDQTIKLFTSGQIIWAAFLGSIVAGGFLINQNLKRTGHHEKATQVFITTLFITISVLAISLVAPEGIPAILYSIPQLIGIKIWYDKSLIMIINPNDDLNIENESNWSATGWGFLFLFFLFLSLIALMYILPESLFM